MIKEFAEEYTIVTFEGIFVALIIATLALVGTYHWLAIACIIQILLIYIIILYKKLKLDTNRAINARVLANNPTELTIIGIKKNIIYNYYKENNIRFKITLYTMSSILLFILSVYLLIYIPMSEESDKKNIISGIDIKIESLSSEYTNLKKKTDSLRNEIIIQNYLLNKLIRKIDSINYNK